MIMWEILKAVAGVLALALIWLAIQRFLRKRLAIDPGEDVLEDMVHGCGNCEHSGTCSGRKHLAHHGGARES